MSTPERRLDVLRRQRALVQQNLAWLDQEIAAAESTTLSATPPAVIAPPASAAGAVPDTDAEAILDQYRNTGPTLQAQVRKGCLLYAGVALAFLLLGAFALSFLFRR